MKKICIIILIPLTVFAMDNKVYLPETPVENPLTGEGYLPGMPSEIKTHIATTISNASTLEKATSAIRAFATTNKAFYALINDTINTSKIIDALITKFGGYHENIAKSLKTHGAQEYLRLNKQWDNIKNLENLSAQFLKKPVTNINFLNRNGSSPLSTIIVMNSSKEPAKQQATASMVKYLVEHGADVNVIDKKSETVLMHAINTTENFPVIQALLNSNITPKTINVQDLGGSTALDRAIFYKVTDIVELLLKAGADLTIKDKNGRTALDIVRENLQKTPNDTKVQTIFKLIEQSIKDGNKRTSST